MVGCPYLTIATIRRFATTTDLRGGSGQRRPTDRAPQVRTPGTWRVLGCAPLRAGLNARDSEFPDTQLVALMRQHGVETTYTRDRDFRRYAEITVRDPVA